MSLNNYSTSNYKITNTLICTIVHLEPLVFHKIKLEVLIIKNFVVLQNSQLEKYEIGKVISAFERAKVQEE